MSMVIERFNQQTTIQAMLERHGYTRQGPTRYIRPSGEHASVVIHPSGEHASVVINPSTNRSYHTGDIGVRRSCPQPAWCACR